MRTQYQLIREILDAVRYPVDPQHEQAFMAMLLNSKKRRRRNLFLLCFVGLALVSAAVTGVVITNSTTSNTANGNDATEVQESGMRSVSVESKANTAPGNSLSAMKEETIPTSNITAVAQAGSSQQGEEIAVATGQAIHAKVSTETTSPKLSAVSQTDPQRAKTSRGGAVVANNKTLSGKNSIHKTHRESGQIAASRNISQPISELQTRSVEPAGSLEVIDALGEHEVLRTNLPTEEHMSADERTGTGTEPIAVNSSSVLEAHHEEIIDETPVIIPAARKSMLKRTHYGVSAAIFPTGVFMSGNNFSTGMGFQIGAYGTYKITPRLVMRADAGFSKLNGGFSYVKESLVEEFGFTVLQQRHALSVEQLYSAYSGAELGIRRGKNTYSLGLQGQLLYGAKGDIESVQFLQDVPVPVESRAEDIWLKTDDMRKVTLQGSIAYRSQVLPRVELSAMLRIPLISSMKKPGDSDVYQYTITKYGLMPQVAISYQLNQQ